MTVGELKIKLSADTGAFEKGMNHVKQALKNMESDNIGTASGAKIVSDIAEAIVSQRSEITQAGAKLFGAIDDGVPAVTEDIKASVHSMMAEVLSSVTGYAGTMESAGKMVGDALAAGIAQGLSNAQLAMDGLYAANPVSQSGGSTYNTYNTTYHASAKDSNMVNMADFENRIRRAYA